VRSEKLSSSFLQQRFGGLKPCLSTLKSAEADWFEFESALADFHALSRGFIPARFDNVSGVIL